MGRNSDAAKEYFIGFSAYDRYRELYEYIEDSCFIADSLETYQVFIENCWSPLDNFQPVRISFLEMLNDFGVSVRKYAIEPLALKRFQAAAEILSVEYRAKPYGIDFGNGEENLFDLRI